MYQIPLPTAIHGRILQVTTGSLGGGGGLRAVPYPAPNPWVRTRCATGAPCPDTLDRYTHIPPTNPTPHTCVEVLLIRYRLQALEQLAGILPAEQHLSPPAECIVRRVDPSRAQHPQAGPAGVWGGVEGDTTGRDAHHSLGSVSMFLCQGGVAHCYTASVTLPIPVNDMNAMSAMRQSTGLL